VKQVRRSLATTLVQFLRRFVSARFTDRYRPELHYMRGPGPKSRGQTPQPSGAGVTTPAALSRKH
jgi:hypothetical protein